MTNWARMKRQPTPPGDVIRDQLADLSISQREFGQRIGM